ncbi:hypothetical protein EVA_09039 [gut metagenome]|uniref:Uncharacterized protein n=1 Tax=gut metagenome TaxID=749906 RepID=J9GRR2_9ZZZZ
MRIRRNDSPSGFLYFTAEVLVFSLRRLTIRKNPDFS